VAALLLEGEHLAGEMFAGDLFALIALADPVVLAEGAPHIAPGEEDGPGAGFPDEGRLLPEVGTGTRDPREETSPAVPDFPGRPVHAAVPGTDPAVCEKLACPGDANLELTCRCQGEERRGHRHQQRITSRGNKGTMRRGHSLHGVPEITRRLSGIPDAPEGVLGALLLHD